jgi:DNA-binding transcriptional ArsR family regulator
MAAASPKSASRSTPAKSSARSTGGGRTSGAGKASKPAPGTRPSAEIRRVADLLKQVSDPTRLQVLMLLSEKERNVSELCTDLGTQSQPAVSHHLALLRHGRLIEPRRSGKHNFYGLTDAGRELARVVASVVRS